MDELVPRCNRRVTYGPSRQFLYSPAHVICHAFEHFEGEKLRYVILLGQLICIGQLEQIVGAYPQMDGLHIGRIYREIQQPFKVGIHIQFVVIGCQRPITEGGLHLLHLHIRAFDNPDSDGASSHGDTFLRPGGESLLDVIGIRQVSLQGRPRVVILELLLIKGPCERCYGDVQIPVFFHVQIDEFGDPGAVFPDEIVTSSSPV